MSELSLLKAENYVLKKEAQRKLRKVKFSTIILTSLWLTSAYFALCLILELIRG